MTEPQDAKAEIVAFNADIGIDTGKTRPELSHKYAKAYTAQGNASNPGNFVALVCEPGSQPRTRFITQYAKAAGVHMPQLINANVIKWPDKSQRMVFVFEDRFGKPIVDVDMGSIALGWKADHVLNAVIKPVLNVLKIMRDVDLSHGSIRPTMLFDGGVKDYERVILGECISAPPSATQPVLYETIERGLALPLGRGAANQTEDLYALGATVAVLMRTRDMLRGPNDADLVRAKQELGSYVALMGDARLSGPVIDFLRGVLADDARERWNLNEALAWLDGHRATPRQGVRKKPAQRQLDFSGGKYLMPQVLATEFILKPHDAASAVEGVDLQQWLMRSLNHDTELMQRYEQARTFLKDPSNRAGGSDKVAAFYAIALDPKAPVRYKELSFLSDGLGTLMCDAYARGASVQSYVDVLQSSLQSFWLSVHDDPHMDVVSATQKVEQCRSLMRNSHNPGFGLERALYMLNPDAPCLSPLFANNYVRTPEDVVVALNETCKTSPKPARLIDRHIISFLSERDRKTIEMHLFDINSPRPAQSYLGTLRCLAALQRRAQIDSLPEITLWMAELAKPVYATFHDRDLRAEVQKRVEKVKEEGRLWRLLDTITDPELLARDMALFSAAFREYRALAQERTSLESRLETPQYFGRRAGMEMAMYISAAIAFLVAGGLAMVFVQQTGGPVVGN